jgi:pimeloyl-ACP methyl ester carboxylesterase
VLCVGEGDAARCEGALADETSVWGFVQPVIAKRTRTCSYDRAGIGFSDPAAHPGTSAAIVADLRSLLRHADVKPPYVLVGHSYGGMNAVLYADLYPAEVAGMVLVDPSHEDQVRVRRRLNPHADQDIKAAINQQRRCVTQPVRGLSPGTDLYKQCIGDPIPQYSSAINAAHRALFEQPAFQRAYLSELESISVGTSGDQVRAARRNFGDMPLTVLSQSPPAGPLAPNQTAVMRTAGYKAVMEMHDDLASRSSRGKNEIVSGTGHYIQFDRPDAVNRAVEAVLDDIGGAPANVR